MNKPPDSLLITGTSTGIGYSAASAFLNAGYRVFGTVRNEDDAVRLRRELGAEFKPLVADVTNPGAVQAAVEAMRRELPDGCLAGLVNNAGIARSGPLANQEFQEIRAMFEVNLFGTLTVIRACLPLLGMRPKHPRAPGKIISISSSAGKMSVPFLGAYVASKHALEGMSNSLRRELMPYEIPVVLVGPGSVKTPIWGKAPPEGAYDHTPFGGFYRSFRRVVRASAEKGMVPEEIAKLLVDIMRAKRPKTRYAPIAHRFANWTLPRLLSDRQLDRMMYRVIGMRRVRDDARRTTG